MHSNTDNKPIGKCKGCPSNLKNRCAVFQHPQAQWSHSHGHCKGYMNETLYQHYLAEQMTIPEKDRREKRQEKMAELKTVEHVDGIANPGGSRW